MDAVPSNIIKLSLEKIDQRPTRSLPGSSSRLHRSLMVSSLLNRALKTDSLAENHLLMNYRETKLIDMCDVDDSDTLDRRRHCLPGSERGNLSCSGDNSCVINSDVSMDTLDSRSISRSVLQSTDLKQKNFNEESKRRIDCKSTLLVDGDHNQHGSASSPKTGTKYGDVCIVASRSNKRLHEDIVSLQTTPCKKLKLEQRRLICDESQVKCVGQNVSSLTALFQDSFGGLSQLPSGSAEGDKIGPLAFETKTVDNCWSCNVTVLMAC